MKFLYAVAAVLFCAGLAHAQVIPFTGDVYADFALTNANDNVNVAWFGDPHNNVVLELNPTGAGEAFDVGVPTGISARSGWDIRSVYFAYDRQTDFMAIAIDCYTICGDADGDGDEDSPGSVLTANGGDDKAALGSSETFIIMLDVENELDDGVFEPQLALGWSTAIGQASTFSLWNFNPNGKFSPPGGLLTSISWDVDALYPNNAGCTFFNDPVVDSDPQDCSNAVDVEVYIKDFSTLPGFGTVDPVFDDVQIKFNIFAGSFEDDGVGEDNIPNQAQPIYYVWPGCDPDECGLCPGEDGFGQGVDSCGLCPQNPLYGLPRDECDLCPTNPAYGLAQDECGVCFGPGRDICDLCPSDPNYELDLCVGCDDIPFSGLIYDECGVCDGDGSTCCEIDSYKGYLPWELDMMLTYYTLVVLHDDLCLTIDVLEESFDYTYNYWWFWSFDEMEPLPFCDWIDVIWMYNDCAETLNLDIFQAELAANTTPMM